MAIGDAETFSQVLVFLRRCWHHALLCRIHRYPNYRTGDHVFHSIAIPAREPQTVFFSIGGAELVNATTLKGYPGPESHAVTGAS